MTPPKAARTDSLSQAILQARSYSQASPAGPAARADRMPSQVGWIDARAHGRTLQKGCDRAGLAHARANGKRLGRPLESTGTSFTF